MSGRSYQLFTLCLLIGMIATSAAVAVPVNSWMPHN
jgi:hypothetical protein